MHNLVVNIYVLRGKDNTIFSNPQKKSLENYIILLIFLYYCLFLLHYLNNTYKNSHSKKIYSPTRKGAPQIWIVSLETTLLSDNFSSRDIHGTEKR